MSINFRLNPRLLPPAGSYFVAPHYSEHGNDIVMCKFALAKGNGLISKTQASRILPWRSWQ